jgi:hypothetical protein
LPIITGLIVLLAFAMALGTPGLLWVKLTRGSTWIQCVPAITFYLCGWIALLVLAARPRHSLALWSLVSGLLLTLSVLVAARLTIPPRSEPLDTSTAHSWHAPPQKCVAQKTSAPEYGFHPERFLGTNCREAKRPSDSPISFRSPGTVSSNSIIYSDDMSQPSQTPQFAHHARFQALFETRKGR